MGAQLGNLAAFATAICWTVSAVFFTTAASRIGSVNVNRARVLLALPMFGLIHLLTEGHVFPQNVEAYRWWWLGLSGVIGLALADSFLFEAFLLIGPRLSLLIMSFVPLISTTAAWIFLKEWLAPGEILGVCVAVGGIGWVVMERGETPAARDLRRYVLGVLLAIASAFGQAVGLVVAKKGMEGEFPAISASMIRMVGAAAVMWGAVVLRGQTRSTIREICNRKVLSSLLAAVVLGAALGIWFSLLAIQYTRLGIAATIMALPPVLMLPLARWWLRERVTGRVILGTLVAFAGIAVLLLS